MRIFTAIFFLATHLLLAACQPAPETTQMSGNPLFPGWYADPEVAIFADSIWIFPTYSARYERQVFFDAFSSPDLVHWQKHERILDTSRVSWAHEAMWAPCVVKNGSRYFFFFAANDIQTPDRPGYDPAIHAAETGGIGVAVADRPGGPYRDYLGHPLISEVYNGAQPIDQFVFRDEDGKYYILYGGWGHCNIGQLNGNFTALEAFDDGDLVKEITPEGYVEGPVMFRRNGWYYLMWSEGNWTDSTYHVAYGRSESILGPFPKLGTVLQSDPAIATGAGHHSVLRLPGTDEWYIVYHRRPIPNEDRDHRVTCIDRMYFDEDGTIRPVKITFEGVAARRIGRPTEQ